MDYINVLWIVGFSLLQVLIFCINWILWNYINSKPLGMQALFDAVMKDLSLGNFLCCQFYLYG